MAACASFLRILHHGSVGLPRDRVRGCRGLVLALVGAAPPARADIVAIEPGPRAHGCRNLTLFGSRWGFCIIRSLATACRRRVAPLMVQFPRLLAARSRFGAAWRPKCRPPRRKTPTMGCRGRGGLRSGHNGARPRVELARKPLNMRVNPLDTHVNLSTCAWEALPTRISSGPRARCRAHARGVGPTRESAGPRRAARSAGS